MEVAHVRCPFCYNQAETDVHISVESEFAMQAWGWLEGKCSSFGEVRPRGGTGCLKLDG